MINVLGLGNVLMGDDGFGPAVVHAFNAEFSVGDEVQVIDLGTPGLDMLPWLADIDHAIVVDTVKSDSPPGTMLTYTKSNVLRHPPAVRVGPHDPGVKNALLTLEFAGRGPRELTLIGVVPARTELAVNLSHRVRAAVEPAVAALVAILERSGVSVVRRVDPQVGDPWWNERCFHTARMEGLCDQPARSS